MKLKLFSWLVSEEAAPFNRESKFRITSRDLESILAQTMLPHPWVGTALVMNTTPRPRSRSKP